MSGRGSPYLDRNPPEIQCQGVYTSNICCSVIRITSPHLKSSENTPLPITQGPRLGTATKQGETVHREELIYSKSKIYCSP